MLLQDLQLRYYFSGAKLKNLLELVPTRKRVDAILLLTSRAIAEVECNNTKFLTHPLMTRWINPSEAQDFKILHKI
jgi:hypothetical protein